MFKFNLFAAMLCLLTLNLMAQTVPRPAGPYFEPLLDWQYRAGISKRDIVIAPGDSIIPQIANSGTPQNGGFFMIFQASNVSTTMATFQVDFFDPKGESMNMPLATSPDDLTGTPARGFQGALSPGRLRCASYDSRRLSHGHWLCRGDHESGQIGCSQRDVLAVSSRGARCLWPACHCRTSFTRRHSCRTYQGLGSLHPGFGVAAVSGCDTDCAHRL